MPRPGPGTGEGVGDLAALPVSDRHGVLRTMHCMYIYKISQIVDFFASLLYGQILGLR